MTNAEKFKEIFGIEPDCGRCNPFPCGPSNCKFWDQCNAGNQHCASWWDWEFEEPRKGHWKYDRAIVRCSNCGRGYKDAFGRTSAITYNFCPNCGAKMIEP